MSLYRLILERTGKRFCRETAWIIHLNSKATPHRAVDYRERLKAWLLKK